MNMVNMMNTEKADCRPILQRKDERKMKEVPTKIKLKKIFVCSPFRGIGDTEEAARKDYQNNIALAKGVCR